MRPFFSHNTYEGRISILLVFWVAPTSVIDLYYILYGDFNVAFTTFLVVPCLSLSLSLCPLPTFRRRLLEEPRGHVVGPAQVGRGGDVVAEVVYLLKDPGSEASKYCELYRQYV